MEIRLVDNEKEKAIITEKILRQLPHWFGVEEALLNYVDNVKLYPMIAAFDGDEAVGFISTKKNNQYTAEVYVMGVLEEHHRRGIGKGLLNKAEEKLREEEYKYIMVKTLGESNNDVYYGRTREFYKEAGFYPLEELKELWDEDNPCLIMVRSL